MAKFIKKGSSAIVTKPQNDHVSESVGKVRRSQLVSTYGVGAIVDLEKGSFMTMGLDDWEFVTKVPSLSINEDRLQQLLQVDHFRLAPIGVELSPGRVDRARAIPVVRFPEWHQCPKCFRIGKESLPFELAANGSELECTGHQKPIKTTPVRFVVACTRGHIEDFPWEWWAHKGREGGCDSPRLELKSEGKSAALADLYVRCKTCGARESLGSAFRADSLKGRLCRGREPWLHGHTDCSEQPRVIQRGASNAYFPVVASALTIPPASAAAFEIIGNYWTFLRAAPAESVVALIEGMAGQMGVSPGPLHSAYQEKKRLEGQTDQPSIASARRKEYEALCQDRTDDEDMGGIQAQFRNSVEEVPASLSSWFELVGAVSRLREVRALAGFTRIEPFPISAENIPAAQKSGRIAPLSKRAKSWLPGAEIRGEGIFLKFNTSAIEEWIANNPGVQARARDLEYRSEALARERGYERDHTITPRLLLVHSFAHALIRVISLDCGYSSSSIRERLYVSEPSDGEEAMNGVLLYTGSPDSEGSLGGLVRLAEPSLLVGLIDRTIRSAQWCGSDPVCLETDPAQSGDRVSGAACHCCLLVPETSCEKFNGELDRTMLVGRRTDGHEESWQGFFRIDEQ